MAAKVVESWEVFDEALPFLGAVYGPQRARMAVLGLGGGDLLVVSPGVPVAEEGWAKLSAWGTPRFLLAPNHFHNAGLAPWKERFPGATVVAHPRALPRLRKRLPGLELHGLEALEAALPDTIRIFGPPSARQGEVLVSAKIAGGAAWFVTDAIVNQERLPGGATGLVMRLAGFRAELMTNPFFRRFFMGDRAAYRTWLSAELDRERPVLFVPSHGAPLRGPEVTERLQALAAAV